MNQRDQAWAIAARVEERHKPEHGKWPIMAEIMAEIEISVVVRERLSRLRGNVATSPQCNGNGNGAQCAIHLIIGRALLSTPLPIWQLFIPSSKPNMG